MSKHVIERVFDHAQRGTCRECWDCNTDVVMVTGGAWLCVDCYTVEVTR